MGINLLKRNFILFSLLFLSIDILNACRKVLLPFDSLHDYQKTLHCFLYTKAQEVYLRSRSNMNTFTVALELHYRSKDMKILYVDHPFCSGNAGNSSELVAFHLTICDKTERKHISALTDSEFHFLTYLNDLNEFFKIEKVKGLTEICIHGFSTQDMCKYCFEHMKIVAENKIQEIPVKIYISSLFEYKHDNYVFTNPDDLFSENILCIPFRKVTTSSLFRIKSMRKEEIPSSCVLTKDDTFGVKKFSWGPTINEVTRTSQVDVLQYKGRTTVSEDAELGYFLRIGKPGNITLNTEDQRNASCKIGEDDLVHCLRLKYYCLGIENPLAFREYLDVGFVGGLELLYANSSMVRMETTEGPLRQLTFPGLSAMSSVSASLSTSAVKVEEGQKDKKDKKGSDSNDDTSDDDDDDDDDDE